MESSHRLLLSVSVTVCTLYGVQINGWRGLMLKKKKSYINTYSITPPFSNLWSMLLVKWVLFVESILFVKPTCSVLTSVWCDTTLVLSKTGTCFSQSGTFSSRRHPINLGINSRACATMAMLTEWQLPCHFRFVPLRESIHAVCRLADLPELAHYHLQKIYTDQSICMERHWQQNMAGRYKARYRQRWDGGHSSCCSWSSGKWDQSLVYAAESLQWTRAHRITCWTTFLLSLSICW